MDEGQLCLFACKLVKQFYKWSRAGRGGDMHFFPHKTLAFTFCQSLTVSGNVSCIWNERPPSSTANFSVTVFSLAYLENSQMIKLTITDIKLTIWAKVTCMYNSSKRWSQTCNHFLWIVTHCMQQHPSFISSLSLLEARPIKAGKLHFLYKQDVMTPENHKVLQTITFLLLETIQLAKL